MKENFHYMSFFYIVSASVPFSTVPIKFVSKEKKVEVALPLHHFTEMKILDKFLILLIGRARIFAFLFAFWLHLAC